MKIRIAALADYASVDRLGKLNIMGIFNQIFASSVPIAHHDMQLVVKMVFQPAEAGEKHARIYLEDVDGRVVLQLDGQFIVPPVVDHEPIEITQILRLQNIVFPDFGSYDFKIEIDDHTELLTPVDLIRTPSAFKE